jgi:hypothetical protein
MREILKKHNILLNVRSYYLEDILNALKFKTNFVLRKVVEKF